MSEVLTIPVLRQRAADWAKRAVYYDRRGNRSKAATFRLYASWDADHARSMEADELAVADMAAMDAGAGDLSLRSVWS